MSWSNYNLPNCLFSEPNIVANGLIEALMERYIYALKYMNSGATDPYYLPELESLRSNFLFYPAEYFLRIFFNERTASISTKFGHTYSFDGFLSHVAGWFINQYSSDEENWSLNALFQKVEEITGKEVKHYSTWDGNLSSDWAIQRYIAVNLLRYVATNNMSAIAGALLVRSVSRLLSDPYISHDDRWATKDEIKDYIDYYHPNFYTYINPRYFNNYIRLQYQATGTSEEYITSFLMHFYELKINQDYIDSADDPISICIKMKITQAVTSEIFSPYTLPFPNNGDGILGGIPIPANYVFLTPDQNGMLFKTDVDSMYVNPIQDKAIDDNQWGWGFASTYYPIIGVDVTNCYQFYDDVES